MIRDAYAALLSVGQSESQARQMIDAALQSRKKYKTAAEMIDAIYQQNK